MYEKPQYLTTNGYQRLDKNPHKKDGKSPLPLKLPVKKSAAGIVVRSKGKPLSDQAAKMIAMVLKDMLKE